MRRASLLAPLLALLLVSGRVTPAEAEAALTPRTRDYDLIHLDLAVELDVDAGTVKGRAALSFTSTVEHLRRLRLHQTDLQVLAVTDENGTPLVWRIEDGLLVADLAEPLAKGDRAEVRVLYRARPKHGLYFHAPTKAHPLTPRLVYSQGEGEDNRCWFPCYDLPDDRFSWDLHVTVPRDLVTVSNGVRTGSEPTDDGRRTDDWRFAGRAPSYLVSVAAGPFGVVEDHAGDVALEYVVPSGHEDEAREALAHTPEMIAFYSSWLGAPYPWPRYAQTFVWDFVYGGMENVTATTLNMRALHRPEARPNYDPDGLVAHELAHMWFGDLLTCRTFDDIWLNEGFATYLCDLWYEHRDGHDAFLERRRSQNRSYMDGTPNAAGLGLERDPRGDKPLELQGGKQYSRGAAILHMLRLELGDELFQKAIRAYVKEHQDDAVSSEDLRHTVEEVAGRDLSWFFDQWVYGAGYPVLDVRFDAGQGRLDVRQVQERRGGQGLFRFTLWVRAGPDGPVLPLRVWRDHHAFQIADGKHPPPYVRVGVGDDLLARVRFNAGPVAWAALLTEDPDVTGRLDAVEALEAEGEKALPALATAARSDAAWSVRAAAVRALGPMDLGPESAQPLVGEALLAAARDPDPRVREAAFDQLGGRPRDEVAATLLTAVKEETHDYPRAAAARSLGRVQASGAYDALLDLLSVDSHEDVVRAGALEGMRALGDPRAAGVARTYCDYGWDCGGTERLRYAAIDAVVALEPDAPETLSLLVSLLDDPHRDMRRKAAEWCGDDHVDAARDRLKRMVREDPDEGVRHAAKRALEKL